MTAFVDTNILVYAEDRDAGSKHRIARALVLDLWRTGTGVISVQVLQELYVTLTRKVGKPMAPAKAQKIVEQYMTWQVVENTTGLLAAGMRTCSGNKLSLWDALVVEAARLAGSEVLYSEDLNHGQRFGPVEIRNPFR